MSTGRRLFEDPRNTYIVENDDPGAFDKRFVGRPGVHQEQRCCRDRAPVWQTHLIHDEDDPGGDNREAFKVMVGIQIEDATGESDNITVTPTNKQMKGYVFVEGPNSGYRPDFVNPVEWMRWQSVYWIPSPRPVPGLPNPPRWVRVPGDRKIRWGEHGGYEFLWCQKCETALETAWSGVLDALPAVTRSLAMVASTVPVFGTAISFALNTTVSLAEGQPIDQSLLDGIAGSLPEQPASGMAFNAAVAIAKGERIDRIAIDALPIDKSLKDVLKVAGDVVIGIASGEAITDVAYRTIHETLPPEAQMGMDFARRVVNGENVPQMILTEAEQIVVNGLKDQANALLETAKTQGADAMKSAEAQVNGIFNQYAAEFGYQMAFDRLPDDARIWIQSGLVGGAALRPSTEFQGTFGSVPESNVAVNDSFERKGEKLIASGIRYRNKPISEILHGATFSIVIDFFDLLNRVWTTRPMTYRITDAWRRGFTIAIGVCEGSSQRGPGQLAVWQTVAEDGGRAGFDAGQAVQHNRTLHGDSGLVSQTVSAERGEPIGVLLQPDAAAPISRPPISQEASARFDHVFPLAQIDVPDFVGLTPNAATELAARKNVPIEFVHAQSQDDVFGEDLQTLMSDEGGARAHSDDEIRVNVQRPVAGTAINLGASVSLGVALAPGVT
jgi:hypothetical protein